MIDQQQARGTCGHPITLTSGHRPRQYCCDACKQAAHRARKREAKRVREEEARLARIQAEREDLCQRYGTLLPQTLDLLLQSFQSSTLIGKMVTVIRAEQEWVRQSALEERNTLLEAFLLLGEQLEFPTLINDDFELEAGLDNWLIFTQTASLPQLHQARDIAYIKIQAANGRKRLLQLAPQA